MAESLDSLEIQWTIDGFYGTMLQRIGKVGRNLRHTFHLAQTSLEEVACSSVFLATLCGLLCCHKIGIGEGLGFYLLIVHQVAQLIQEQVERSTVEYQVMHIRQEIYAFFSSNNLHTVQRSLSQVKRLDEISHIFLYFGFA